MAPLSRPKKNIISPREARPRLLLALALASLGALSSCADAPPTTPQPSLTTRTSALTAAVPGDYATIQAAVDAAGDGDTVQIDAGTYNENVTLKTGITLVGSGIDMTTVYGTLTLTGLSDVTISDLTLRGDLTVGATGIDATDATFTLERVIVRDFAVCARVSGTTDVTVDRVQLRRSEDDGLLVQGAAGVTMTNSVLSTNQRHGLRIAPGATGSVTISNSLFWGNGWPSQGAALRVGAAGFDLVNTIVTANRRGLDCSSACSNNHNIIWGNFTDYVDLAVAGQGNLAVDPGLTNLNEGNFTLVSQSPAIDAGTSNGAPDHDYFGLARPSGSGVDIGPHEYPQNVVAAVLITEVMANPLNEGTGEFIELLNPGDADIAVDGWLIDDGDSTDILTGFAGGTTTIPAGGFAVVVDPDYDAVLPTFVVPADTVLLTVASSKTLGSGLSTGDPVRLWDGGQLIDSFGFPFDPGNGVSIEKEAIEDGDVQGNWVASPCGSSPGADNCSWAPPPDEAGMVITEVMANPLVEKSGEYIEIYNDGAASVDVASWIIDDGDSQDALVGWQGGTTVVPAASYAVILDPDYADNYVIAPEAVLLTVASSLTLGNALSTSDPITLRDGTEALIDTFSHPFDPGNGTSIERESPSAPDIASSWSASNCADGGSPGSGNCVPVPPVVGPTTIAITEVMANALDEDTGEFVELYNFGLVAVDLESWSIGDGDKVEPLGPFVPGSTMQLQPGAFALVMDSEYVEGTYAIGASVLRLRTPDSSIASGLATTDPITLYAPDGAVVSTWTSPFNPGNGISAQQVDLLAGDVPDNWVATVCGASPGAIDCDGGPVTVDIALTALGVVISEVMSNPLTESTGEFVELYNAGTTPVDLTTLSIRDHAYTDTLVAYNGGPTVLVPGAYGVIIDSGYAGEYAFSGGELIVTTPDKALGNGLATSERVTLYNGDGDVLSTYAYPINAGNGFSVERAIPTAADSPDAWVKSNCASGSSPAAPNCTSPGAPAEGSLADGEACPFGSGECEGGVCMHEALTDVSLCASDCSIVACSVGFDCAATGDAVWSQVCWPEGDDPVDPVPGEIPSLLLTELVVSPGAAEYVEIHNPNAFDVALDNIYLADYYGYEGITVGSASPNSADFRMHFPVGASIAAGAYLTISMESASHFESEHGQYPDYDTWPGDGNAPSMIGQIGGSAGLGNGSEMVVMFYWDGATALLTDLDYIVYGGTAKMGMDKTGVTVGVYAYADETPISLQTATPSPGYGASLERCDLAETGQTDKGGNGANGEDHTSEPFPSTWQVVAAGSPGVANQACIAPCVPACTGDCGSNGCGGSCGSCGANEHCEVDTCLPIAVGLTLTVVNKGWNGWKLPEGFGTTHTLLLFTNAMDFQNHFGVAPPSEADFGTEDVLFFSVGSQYLSAGNNAVVTDVVDNTVELFVFTTRTYPEEDCIGMNLPVPVWNMYTVTKPASGATTLTEIYGEEDIWCLDPGSAVVGESCGPTQVCGEDLICAGLTYGGDGLCNPKWMWGTFYGATPVDIPDAGQVVLPLVISAMASVEVDVVLYVDITHPDPSQLTLTMLNPLNEEGDISQAVVVFDQVPGGGPDLLIHQAILGFSGDEVANGEWALVVEDHTAGSTGTVNVLWTEMTSRWD